MGIRQGIEPTVRRRLGGAIGLLGLLTLAWPSIATAEADDPAPALEVRVAAACAAVEERACVGEATRFTPAVGKVWAYLELRNLGPKVPIRMVWSREGKQVATADLEIGRSKRWRTWSRQRMGKWSVGAWTVEVRGPGDRLLTTIPFTVSVEAP